MAAGGVVLAATLALGLSAWLAPASAQIVAWGPDGPRIMALVPPLRALWSSLGVALVLGGAVVGVWRSVWGRPLEALSRRAAPLLLLVLWGLPYLPEVADRLPLLLVLAGPAKWAVASIAGLGVAWPWLSALGERVARATPPRLALFAAAFALFLIGGVTTMRTIGPGGDEPHYLVIAHSLVHDGDLQIENNHNQRDYASFFADELKPDFLARGIDGVIYSVHAPGLPAVIAPAYAVAGYAGAVVMMVFLAALLTVAIHDLAREVTGDGPARLVWAVTTVTVPMTPLAWMIYPEVLVALLVAWAARWVVEPIHAGAWGWMVRGAALAVMPWLHTKFAVLLACVGVGLAVRLWPRLRLLAALAAPVVVSVSAWLGAFYLMYGRIDPMAAYGGDGGLSLSNVPRGILGLALDQEFGLLHFSPVYLLAGVGAWWLLRGARHRWFTVWSLATAGVFLGTVTQAYMWWGGTSAPARFLLPLVPLAAPMLAATADAVRRPVLAGAWWVTGVWSGAVVLAGWTSIRLAFLLEDGDGVSRLMTALGGPAPLGAALASFRAENWSQSLAQAAPWLVAVMVALWLSRLAARATAPTLGNPVYWAGVALVGGVFAVGAGLGGPALSATERSTVERLGRGALLSAIDGDRLVGLSHDPLSWLPPEELLPRLSLSAGASSRRPFGDGSTPSTLLGPFNLPAGRYELRLFRTDARDPMTVSIVYYLRRMRGTLVDDTNGFGNPIVLAFELPVGLDGVWARVPGDGGTVSRVDVAPLDIEPRSARVDRGDGVRDFRRLPGAGGGSISFIDDATVPANGYFLVRPQRTGVVVVAVPDGRQAVLRVTNTGTVGDDVRIAAREWAELLRLAPGESGRIWVPVTPNRTVTAVAVTTTAPADVERPRQPICRVRIHTERRR